MEFASSLPEMTIAKPVNRLVGRGEACRALCARLISSENQLLTLTGMGGVGKTSLALAVGYQVQHTFAHGACWVPLAALRDPGLVLPTLALALRQEIGTRSPFAVLRSFLADKQLLLLLDNLEHLLTSAPPLAALLAACPGVKLVVTSRERLRIEGEEVWEVPALAVPTQEDTSSLTTLSQIASVQLFVERAHARDLTFSLHEHNAASVAEICRRLHGLPLALELAATRIALLPPQALLSRLRLSLLTGGQRGQPERLQTMRATIQWSYDLLSSAERTLFRHLCVFVGGCTLEAVETLTTALGNEATEQGECAASLVEKHLVVLETPPEAEPRLVVLETIREFGLACLAEAGEQEQAQQAHTRYYLQWAQAACRSVFGHEQMLWLRRFVLELGNLRAVMQYLLTLPQRQQALVLGAHLSPIWFLWGSGNHYSYMLEGKDYLERTLRDSEQEMGWARARCLCLSGGILAVLRDVERGREDCQQGIALFRQMNDLQGVIQGLWMAFYPSFVHGDLLHAKQTAEEAVSLSQQHPEVCTEWGAAWTQGYSLFLAGYVAVWDGRTHEANDLLRAAAGLLTQAGDALVAAWTMLLRSTAAVFAGNAEEARPLLEQGIPRYRALGMNVLGTEALILQGYLALYAGETVQAQTLLTESLRLAQEVRDERRITWAQIELARVGVRTQQFSQARAWLSEALSWTMRKQDRVLVAIGLEVWASLVAAQDEPAWAVRVLGTAQALREATHAPVPQIAQGEQHQQIAVLRTVLGEGAFKTAWKQGRGMTAEQVVLPPEAVASALPVPPHPLLSTQAPILALSRREREVLLLVAEGLTNRQIAERLVLSTLTVNSYLSSVFRKLGVSTRTAALRCVLDHHLLS